MAGSALSDQGLEHAYVQKENMDGTELDNHRLVYGDQFCLRSDQIMTSFFVTLAKFCMSFVRGLRDPEFRALFIALAGLLLSGTIFYSTIEGWGLVDSLYFCVMTLSTVGYGDLNPTGPISKIFTIIYILVGLGIFVAFITKMSEQRSRRSHKGNTSEEDEQDEKTTS